MTAAAPIASISLLKPTTGVHATAMELVAASDPPDLHAINLTPRIVEIYSDRFNFTFQPQKNLYLTPTRSTSPPTTPLITHTTITFVDHTLKPTTLLPITPPQIANLLHLSSSELEFYTPLIISGVCYSYISVRVEHTYSQNMIDGEDVETPFEFVDIPISPTSTKTTLSTVEITTSTLISFEVARAKPPYTLIWTVGDIHFELSALNDPTLTAQTITIGDGPFASSICYIYGLIMPNDNSLIVVTTFNPNPDIYRLLTGLNYALLTGGGGVEGVVGWNGGGDGRINFDLLPVLNYSESATPKTPPPNLHKLPNMWLGPINWFALLKKTDIVELLLAVTGGCSVVAISEDANRAAFFVNALSYVIRPLEAKPLVSRATPKDLETLLEFGGGFIVGYEGSKGFELVDLDAIVVDLDGGTLKTPTVYRSRVPPPAIAKAAKEGYEIGGPREAFVRILAQACAELESCLSWINENEVKLEEKKLIKALGESEWATYFVGSSPLLELFERIAWRGEDGGLSSWIRGVEERHRSGEGSNILVIDTSDPKDEERSWPSTPLSLKSHPNPRIPDAPSGTAPTITSSCPFHEPKKQLENILLAYLTHASMHDEINVTEVFSAWERFQSVQKSEQMFLRLLQKVEDCGEDMSGLLQRILPSSISERNILLLGTWRRVLSSSRSKPPSSPTRRVIPSKSSPTTLIWSRTTTCVDCQSVFTDDEVMTSWDFGQIPCFHCGMLNFLEPRLGFKEVGGEEKEEEDGLPPTSTYLTDDIPEIDGAYFVPFLAPSSLLKRIQNGDYEDDDEVNINLKYWIGKFSLSPSTNNNIYAGFDYHWVLSHSNKTTSILLQNDWTSPSTSPILCSLLTPDHTMSTYDYTKVLLLLTHHIDHNALKKIKRSVKVCEKEHTWCGCDCLSGLERVFDLNEDQIRKRVAFRSVFDIV